LLSTRRGNFDRAVVVGDKNRWNQRKITKVAKIHNKNQVFSKKRITTFSSVNAKRRAQVGSV
jgi:hypothetical protein